MADQAGGGLQRTQSKAQRKKAKAKARKAAAKATGVANSNLDPNNAVDPALDDGGDDDDVDVETPRESSEDATPAVVDTAPAPAEHSPSTAPSEATRQEPETATTTAVDSEPAASTTNGNDVHEKLSEPTPSPVTTEPAADAAPAQSQQSAPSASSESSEAQALAERLATERDSAVASVKNLEASVQQLTEKSTQLSSALSDLQDSLQKEQTARAEADRRAAEAESRAAEAESRAAEAESRAASLQAQLDSAKQTEPAQSSSSSDEDLAAAKSEIESLKATIVALKKQVEDLQVEEAVLKDELLEEGKRLRSVEAAARRVPSLEKQIADLQELLDLGAEIPKASSAPAKSDPAPSPKPAEPKAEPKPAAPAAATVAPKPEPKPATPAVNAEPAKKAETLDSAPQASEAPRKKITDRWPAAAGGSQQAEQPPADRPVASNTKGKIDLSQRWPAAAATSSSVSPKPSVPQPREKASGAVKLDAEAVLKAYSAVRDDSNPTNWAAFQHDETGTRIGVVGSGSDGLPGLLALFQPDNRVYGFVRVVTGDSMSKRAKFVLLVWAGSQLSALKRARHATDKATLKEIVREFAVEMSANSLDEFTETAIVAACRKAGGADYNAQL